MIELSTGMFYVFVVYAGVGALTVGHYVTKAVISFFENKGNKKKLLQTQRELAEAQLQALKGRGM
jgi:hypothetical protein